ncbi:hypothetical protein GQ44DRAFT_763096, partial [Phaeosphaeriaceae sp. PMI808]
MESRRKSYMKILDSLLDAGDNGQPLQTWHLPHLDQAKMQVALPHLHKTRLQVALPAVLVNGCFHVAEISSSGLNIRYKEILCHEEADGHHNLLLFPEACKYVMEHWKSSLLQFEPSHIRQTRHCSGDCTWSVFVGGEAMFMETRHRSEFMELARKR